MAKEERNYCKECENAKGIQKYRPSLYCSRHRAIINENTIPGAISGCKGKHFSKRK